MFLTEHEHEGAPGIECLFSALGDPWGGRDAGDQETWRCKARLTGSEVLTSGSEAPSSQKSYGPTRCANMTPKYHCHARRKTEADVLSSPVSGLPAGSKKPQKSKLGRLVLWCWDSASEGKRPKPIATSTTLENLESIPLHVLPNARGLLAFPSGWLLPAAH